MHMEQISLLRWGILFNKELFEEEFCFMSPATVFLSAKQHST